MAEKWSANLTKTRCAVLCLRIRNNVPFYWKMGCKPLFSVKKIYVRTNIPKLSYHNFNFSIYSSFFSIFERLKNACSNEYFSRNGRAENYCHCFRRQKLVLVSLIVSNPLSPGCVGSRTLTQQQIG